MRVWVILGAALALGCGGSGSPRPVEEHARDTTGWTSMAAAKFQAGDYDGAIRDCKRALVDNPNDAEAYFILGRAHLAQNHADPAIDGFSNAVRCDQSHARGWFWRGYTQLNHKGMAQEALRDLHRAIEIEPSYGDAYLWRGATYRQLKDFKLAAADFEKACSLQLSRPEWQQKAAQWLPEARAQSK